MMLTQARHSLNSLFSPHLVAHHTPSEAKLPTEAKYHSAHLPRETKGKNEVYKDN